jgi:hypothetical protein
VSGEAFGSLAVNPDTGQLYQLRPGGWEPISEEAAAAPQGVAASALRSTGMLLGGVANMVGAEYNLSGLQQAQQAGMASNPVATTVGEYLPDVVGMVAPFMGPGGRVAKAAGAVAGTGPRMAERVALRIEQQSARRQAAAGGLDDSVGAASAAGAAPQGIKDTVGRFVNDMLNAPDMTPDQTRMLPVGQRLGFEELPGMRGRGDSPGKMMLGASLSRPDVRFALQDTLEHNASLLEGYGMRALQAPAEPFGKGGIEFARRGIAAGFQRTRRALPEQVDLPEKWVADFAEVRGELASELKILLKDGTRTISRDDLMALRSDLNLVAGDLAAPGSGRRLAGNRLGKLSTELDNFIGGLLGPEEAASWQRTREAWLFSELLKKPGVVQPDGSLSLASAAGVMRRELPDAWADVLEGSGRSRLSPEASDFVDALDYANTFRDLVPNSGTATRQAIGKMSLREQLQGQVLRVMLARERDRLNPPAP